jgi:hypothetical protein
MNNTCILCPQFFDCIRRHTIIVKWRKNEWLWKFLKRNDLYENFEKRGGSRERGEEETKSMPHAPVLQTKQIYIGDFSKHIIFGFPYMFCIKANSLCLNFFMPNFEKKFYFVQTNSFIIFTCPIPVFLVPGFGQAC